MFQKIKSLIVIILYIIFFVSCTQENVNEFQNQVSKPTFTPVGGIYSSSQIVTISTATEDAFIYYTIDGNNPTEASFLYDEPIELIQTTVLKAIATKESYEDSEIVSAEYEFNVDLIPPVKPLLYSHQGDTGDIVSGDTLNFFKIGDSVLDIENGNENNGIDAVASTLKPIQIQWGSLIDTDLSHIVIHRFNTLDTDTLAIAQISPDFNSYDDFVPFWDTDWFYSIEVFDEAGNSALSDTVCYHLLDTPILLNPSNEATVTSINDIQFQWMKQESIEIVSYRLLVFDADRNLLWSFSPTDIIEGNVFTIPYAGEISTTPEIIWRVDAFGNSKDLEINGTIFTIPAGSESEERRLYIAK